MPDKTGISWELYAKLGGKACHFVVMLCKESGLETEKAMRMTCAWLYASGRSRS